MLNEFIEKVVVHETDKSTGDRRQKVDIYFSFIGFFVPPKPEVILTAEEETKAQKALAAKNREREQNKLRSSTNRDLTAVSQADALPGDIVLYPDASHVGMVVGRNEAGKLLVCYCSSGQNNVVITEFAVSGFTVVGRLSFTGS